MLNFTKTVTAAALLGAFALSSPVLAQDAAPAAKSHATKATKPAKGPEDGVEASIAALKAQLKITDAQSAQWEPVATVMRDNAKADQERFEAREANAATATAVDDLKAYSANIQAHADEVKKMEAAFETLYNALSDDQKKIADGVFAKQHPGAHGLTKNKAPKKAG